MVRQSIHTRAGPFTVASWSPIISSPLDLGICRGHCFHTSSSLTNGAGQFKPLPEPSLGSLAHMPSCSGFLAYYWPQRDNFNGPRSVCHFLVTPPHFHTGTKIVVTLFLSFNACSISPPITPVSELTLLTAHPVLLQNTVRRRPREFWLVNTKQELDIL